MLPAEPEKAQYLSEFNCNCAKKGTGESGLPSILCPVNSDRANFIVGSSSDPMVTGQGARDC